MPVGVSIVICCFNSAIRIEKTLKYLLKQSQYGSIPWEVIVVDNGSTDHTISVAERTWDTRHGFSLRVVQEPMPGLSNARIRGFEAARYEYVSFVDDDNGVAENWVATVFKRMDSDAAIGACGCYIEGALDGPQPEWWNKYCGAFAIGRQWQASGDVSHSKGWLYGAGLTVRKSAFELLRKNGFQFATTDRKGTQLTGGGDTELCYALKGAGYKLWLDWDLQLEHTVPRQRLHWDYLRRLYRASGSSSLVLQTYVSGDPTGAMDRVRMKWWWQLLATFRAIVSHPNEMIEYLFEDKEGSQAVLNTEARIGKIVALWRMQGDFENMAKDIRSARWWGCADFASTSSAPK